MPSNTKKPSKKPDKLTHERPVVTLPEEWPVEFREEVGGAFREWFDSLFADYKPTKPAQIIPFPRRRSDD